MKNYNILVLNKFYFPIAIEGVQKVFGNIFSGSMIPLDIIYEQENGCANIEIIEYFTPVSDVEDWFLEAFYKIKNDISIEESLLYDSTSLK